MRVTTHSEQLAFLKKIEGQIRGIQKMIEDGRYCVDILTQIHSAMGALARVEEKVLRKHMEGCVAGAMKSGSKAEQSKKIDEVIELISRLRKIG
jgi:DNA-binding FrmR family transcriptional regulator